MVLPVAESQSSIQYPKHLYSLMIQQSPMSTLFPYTTLFRSGGASGMELPESAGESSRSYAAARFAVVRGIGLRSEEHTSELQSHSDLVCRLLLEKKKE